MLQITFEGWNFQGLFKSSTFVLYSVLCALNNTHLIPGMALTAKIVSCSSPEAFSSVSMNPQKPLLDPRRFFLTK